MIQVPHVEVRYDLWKHLPTSFLTKITMVIENSNIVIPKAYVTGTLTGEVKTTEVDHIPDVGLLNTFSQCSLCRNKVKESDIRSFA